MVALDGFGGYKTAATEVLPEAATAMDPLHVVALTGAKLDLTRQRIQQQTRGHRGRSGRPPLRRAPHPAHPAIIKGESAAEPPNGPSLFVNPPRPTCGRFTN